MCPPRSDNLLGGEVPRRVCGSGARYHEAANRVHKARVPADAPGRIPSPSAAHPKWISTPVRLRQSPARRPPRPAPRCSPVRGSTNASLLHTEVRSPPSCIVSSITGPSHAGLTAPAVAPHLSLRGGHIGTGNSAVTDVTDGAISRRRSPVANFTVQSTLNGNIVTFANVVLIACSVARTVFPIRKVVRFFYVE
jgi:hypothetical protein